MEHLESQLPAAEVELSDELLDRIDEIVAPGVNVNPSEQGWDNPALEPGQRRRYAVPPSRFSLAGSEELKTGRPVYSRSPTASRASLGST
jgi:hypothetical protein